MKVGMGRNAVKRGVLHLAVMLASVSSLAGDCTTEVTPPSEAVTELDEALCKVQAADLNRLCSYGEREESDPTIIRDPHALAEILGGSAEAGTGFDALLDQVVQEKKVQFRGVPPEKISANFKEYLRQKYLLQSSEMAMKSQFGESLSVFNEAYEEARRRASRQIRESKKGSTIQHSQIFFETWLRTNLLFPDATPAEKKIAYEEIFKGANRAKNRYHQPCEKPVLRSSSYFLDLYYENGGAAAGKLAGKNVYKDRSALYTGSANDYAKRILDNPKDFTRRRNCRTTTTSMNVDLVEKLVNTEGEPPKTCILPVQEAEFASNSAVLTAGFADRFKKLVDEHCPEFKGKAPVGIQISSSSNSYRNAPPYCPRDFAGLSRDRANSAKSALLGVYDVPENSIVPRTSGDRGDGTSGPCPYRLNAVTDVKKIDAYRKIVEKAGSPFPTSTAGELIFRDVKKRSDGSEQEVFYSETPKTMSAEQTRALKEAKHVEVTLLFDNQKNVKTTYAGTGKTVGRGDRYVCNQIDTVSCEN